MLTKRIIACLDVMDGRTVKGRQFENLSDAGDAVSLARQYSQNGIDELVFLDITATLERRNTFTELVTNIASEINIPFTVGGGIKTLSDVERLLSSGADKVSLNSAAVNNPELISAIAKEFGSQCLVIAIDSRLSDGENIVYINSGSKACNLKTIDWAREVYNLGAGEILLTSIDNDGSKQGFNNTLIAELSSAVKPPVIASGGAGTMQHFLDVFCIGQADAALAASVFHYGIIPVKELKLYLNEHGVSIRI